MNNECEMTVECRCANCEHAFDPESDDMIDGGCDMSSESEE